jgi:thioesterase domain-containing protein
VRRIEITACPAGGAFDAELAQRADVLVHHEGGRLPPLAFVCAWSSDVRHLHHLAARLDPEQPIYAIMPPDFTSKSEYPETIPEWADFVQERLAAVPCGGVYRIGGYSLAGLIALELAERCADAGAQVPLVLLLDVWVPRALGREGKRRTREQPRRLAKLAERLTRYAEIPTRRERRAHLWHRLSPTRRAARRAEREEQRRQRAVELKNRWGDEPVPEGQAMTNAAGREISFLRRAVQVAYLKYQAHPTQLPLALIRTQASCARAGDDATMGWSHRIRGSFHSVVVPGTHFTMFEPEHLPELAAAVDRILRAARDERGSRSDPGAAGT